MKLFAYLAYLGTNYSGFQKQMTGQVTIQGVLEETLKVLLPDGFILKGAGRTDKGVHARRQAISFTIHHAVDLEDFRASWNKLLPQDIVISSLKEIPDSFDARHSSVRKVYAYRFSFSEKNPFLVDVAFIKKENFDYSLYQQALSYFLGKHNFQNFTSKEEDIDDFCRDILISQSYWDKDICVSKFEGNGFMRRQVRMMVGAAIEVAYQRKSLSWLEDLLIHPSPRRTIKMVAEAKGLTLEDVLYE